MKKILTVTFLSLFLFAHAQMVDGVAIIVDNQPIMISEIAKMQAGLKISKQEAIDQLIIQKLQKNALESIKIGEDEVDQKIADIAARNKISESKMRTLLKQQGTSWIEYRKNIKKEIQKQKFFQEVVMKSIEKPSEDELKLYYKNHKEMFSLPTSITMTEYKSKTKRGLEIFFSNPLAGGGDVTSRKITQKIENISPSLLPVLLQTPSGNITPAIDAGNGYIVYYVESKNGVREKSFEDSRKAILQKWEEDQRESALKDYFEKQRTKAVIEVIRD
ncbi:MAG: peptidyl-prolyl cis-trans isomerase [Campylobacterales bacterium]|nr:peptidyl-prolyl cis-trans isomerase [Campylobacterales bacterium]